MYLRHYSAYHYADQRERKLFVGPGEKVVLRTERGDAFFVWRKSVDWKWGQVLQLSIHSSAGGVQAMKTRPDPKLPSSSEERGPFG